MGAREKAVKRTTLKMSILALGLTVSCVLAIAFNARATIDVSPAEARAIAKEAYIYGFPMVDSYRIQYDCFRDTFENVLSGCNCNAARCGIRKGFVDKAAAVAQLSGNLSYRAPLCAQHSDSRSVHNYSRPSKPLTLRLRVP